MSVYHILREASASLLVLLYRAIPEPPYVERATVQTSRFLYPNQSPKRRSRGNGFIAMTVRTKMILSYVGGIVTSPIILIFIIALFFFENESSLFKFEDKDYKEFEAYTFVVNEVIPDAGALAKVGYDYESENSGLEVLLSGENGKFYDKQKIVVNDGQKAIQTGTYRHLSQTVPIIEIWDK